MSAKTKSRKTQSTERKTGMATVQEVCEYLRVSKHTIYRLINQGKLPATIIGETRRVDWTDIYALHRSAS